MISKLIKKIGLLGWKMTSVCVLKKLYFSVLKRIFHFDIWHARSPYECRRYKQIVTQIVNDLHPESVVDMGCGLGEIISKIQCSKKFGIDIDPHVIQAARFLSGASTTFLVGNLTHIHIPIEIVDVLICVDVLSHLSLERQIDDYFMSACSRLKTKYLIIDSYSIENAVSPINQPDPSFSTHFREYKRIFDGEARWLVVYQTISS